MAKGRKFSTKLKLAVRPVPAAIVKRRNTSVSATVGKNEATVSAPPAQPKSLPVPSSGKLT